MKTILNILVFLVILSMGLGIGFVAARINTPVVKLVPVQSPIPSQREIQQRLTDFNDPRYDPNGVDGWIGTDSRKAWDNYTKDQYAIREFEGRQR